MVKNSKGEKQRKGKRESKLKGNCQHNETGLFSQKVYLFLKKNLYSSEKQRKEL